MVYTCNLSIGEVEAGGSGILGQPGLHVDIGIQSLVLCSSLKRILVKARLVKCLLHCIPVPRVLEKLLKQ